MPASSANQGPPDGHAEPDGDGLRTDTGQISFDELERRLEEARAGDYVLRLFVSGTTPRSTAAIANVKRICDEHLSGRYQLEVIDVYQQPELARDQQLIAAPTLIKQEPPPARRLVGNLSDEHKVMISLDIRSTP
jgi:circadian clock protein KaiB